MEELYLGLCYGEDQGFTDYEGSNAFVKKVSADFGEKPYDICSDDDDMLWVVFKSTPEKIFNYLRRFNLGQDSLEDLGYFFLKKSNDSHISHGWVRDEETLVDSGWELKDGGDYSITYDPDTLDLDRDHFSIDEEDAEEGVNSALEESYRMIENIEEFDERVIEAYNTLNSSLGRLPSSNDILEYLQDKYEEYEDVDGNPMTLVSYLNAISSTLEEKGLKEGEYVDSAEVEFDPIEKELLESIKEGRNQVF